MRRKLPDDGAIAVVVAISAVVLFGFAALVVDVGNAQDLKSQAQTALDSAALAAAQQLTVDPNADIEDVVENLVDENLGDVRPRRLGLSDAGDPFMPHSSFWHGCTTQLPPNYVAAADTPCISWDPAQAIVSLRLPEMKVTVTFGGIAGIGTFHLHLASAAKGIVGASAQLCPSSAGFPIVAPACAAPTVSSAASSPASVPPSAMSSPTS